MIKNFADNLTRDIYDGTDSRYPRKFPSDLHRKAQRLLDQINAAPSINILKIPPGNRLETLSGRLSGFWSLRINEQGRIIFRWIGKDAFDVQIIDYH